MRLCASGVHELHFEVVRAVQKVVVAARIHRFHAAYIALLFARPLFAVIKRHRQPRYRGRRQRDDRAHKRGAHLLFCRSLLLRLSAFVLVAGGGTVARSRGLFPFAHMLLLINRNCEIYLPVGHAVERSRLVDHARYGVREPRAPDAVEHHRRHRDLSGVRLSPRLSVDHPREQREIGRGVAAAGGRGRGQRHAESRRRTRTHHAVGTQPVGALEIYNRLARPRTEYPVHRAVVVAPIFELPLHLGHLVARGSLSQRAARTPRVPAAGRGRRRTHPESRRRRGAHYAVRAKPVDALEIHHRLARPRAEYPVNRAVVVAPIFEFPLHLGHLVARGTLPQRRGVRFACAPGAHSRQDRPRDEQENDERGAYPLCRNRFH